MKTKTYYEKVLHLMPSLKSLKITLFIFSVLTLSGNVSTAQAQDDKLPEYSRPSWHFGVSGGANFNFYRGTTQQLNSELTVPTAFRHGTGIGLFLAPSIEYYKQDALFGFILQAGYDSRKGDFDQVTTACNCPADLSADVTYISIEPSLRFAPFRSDFYMYAGPRIAFNKEHSFTYQLGVNPSIPDQTPTPEVNGEFSDVNNMVISMQIGAGYDIQLSSKNHKTQFVLSPYVAYHPQIGQDPRSSEDWHLSTLRAGITLKFGRGKEVNKSNAVNSTPYVAIPPSADFAFNSPANVPVERRVLETFPVLNYVFFDLGSTKIPKRYVQLNRSQVKDFKEDQLEVFTPKKLSGRSARELIVYYNVLNILGDRMNKNPETTIKLVGSSEKGVNESKILAEKVKSYLVDIFTINPSRITVEGRELPKISEVQPGGTKELVLLSQGDRRVTIESSSPKLLMQFQSGNEASLAHVELVNVQTAPVDSYVSMNVDGAKEKFSSWSIEVKDDEGVVQKFGPYTNENVSIPGKEILGSRTKGDYKVTMIGLAKNGTTVRKDTTVQMVLWTPDTNEQGIRYSIVYGFNDSNSIDIYDKYLTDVVTPQIHEGYTVFLHGYTDIIGDFDHNEKLSLARANNVRSILEKSLAKSKTKNVTIKVLGLGESLGDMPFGNKLPEQRFYNRTVIIDIIPAK